MTVAEFHLVMNCGNAAVGVAEQSGCIQKCCGPRGQLTLRIIHIIIFFADLVTHTVEFGEALPPHWESSASHAIWCAGIVLSWLLLALEGGILTYFIYLYKYMQSGIVYDYYCLRWLSRIQQSLKFPEEWLLVSAYAAIASKDNGALRAMTNKISVCVSLFACVFRCLIIFISACCYRRSNLYCWCNVRKCTVVPLLGCKGGCCGRCGCCSIPGCIHWHLTLFSCVSLVMVVLKFVAIFSDVFSGHGSSPTTEMPRVPFLSTSSTVGIDQSDDYYDLMFFYLYTVLLALIAAIVQCFFWNLCASCTFKKPIHHIHLT